MNSAFRRGLSDDAFQREVEYVCARREQLLAERRGSEWAAKRERYERFAAGEFGERLGDPTLPEIFRVEGCNESLNIVRNVNTFLEARICRDLFGSEPFFAAKPEGPVQQVLADQIQAHFGYKLKEAKFEAQAKTVVAKVLDLGECPVKVTWRVEPDQYEELAMVLHDRATGEPVLGEDGEAITPGDMADGSGMAEGGEGDPQIARMGADWGEDGEGTSNIQHPTSNVEGGEEGTSNVQRSTSNVQGGGADGMADGQGQMAEGQDAQLSALNAQPAPVVIKGVTLDDRVHEWREVAVPRVERLYAGLDVHPCKWQDVFYPMNTPDLERADMVGHHFDMLWSDLKAKYNPGPSLDEVQQVEGGQWVMRDGSPLPDGWDAEVELALQRVKAGNTVAQAEEGKPETVRGEGTTAAPTAAGQAQQDLLVHCAEAYYDHDLGDGVKRRLFMVVVPELRVALTADYRVKVCPRAEKPIKMVSIRRRMNRVDGVGNWEHFEGAMRQADLWLNLTQYQARRIANPGGVWNPHRTEEGKANPNLKVQVGLWYTSSSNQFNPADIFQEFKVADNLERAWMFMQFWMQLVQAESGVTNAAQAAVSSLPGNDLATGINALAEVASILHLHLLGQVKNGFEEVLGYAAMLTYLSQDADETYEYLEGSGAGQQATAQVLALADAQQLAHLPLKVEISLTRAKRQQDREAATAAIPLGQTFGQLAPLDQQRMKPVYEQAFAGLGFDHPESFFATDEEIAQGVAAQMQQQGYTITAPGQGAQPALPPGVAESLAIKFSDLPPTAKAYVLAALGIPVPIEELQAQEDAEQGGDPQISQRRADSGRGAEGTSNVEGGAPAAGSSATQLSTLNSQPSP